MLFTQDDAVTRLDEHIKALEHRRSELADLHARIEERIAKLERERRYVKGRSAREADILLCHGTLRQIERGVSTLEYVSPELHKVIETWSGMSRPGLSTIDATLRSLRECRAKLIKEMKE